MKRKILMYTGAFILFSGFTLRWEPATKFVDGTLIGTEAKGIFYQVEMDNVVINGVMVNTFWAIPSAVKGSPHTFRVRTVLGALDNTGQPYRSAWSQPLGWIVPLAEPGQPVNLQVVP